MSKDNKRIILANELHKPVRKRFVKRRIITTGIDDLWAIDLMDMIQFSKYNKGFKYIFVVIDTFSKKLWIEAMKTKSGVESSVVLKKIIERALNENRSSPNFIHADKGREFVNKKFAETLDEFNIHMYHTQNLEKSAIAERVIRTIKNKLKKLFEINRNKIWYNKLSTVESEYNNKDYHSSIKMKPSEVCKDNESIVLKNLFPKENLKPLKIKFKVGDRVRITKYIETFNNKFSNNWTREIFVVSKIVLTRPVTYKIEALNGEEIKGSFYNEELQKTAL